MCNTMVTLTRSAISAVAGHAPLASKQNTGTVPHPPRGERCLLAARELAAALLTRADDPRCSCSCPPARKNKIRYAVCFASPKRRKKSKKATARVHLRFSHISCQRRDGTTGEDHRTARHPGEQLLIATHPQTCHTSRPPCESDPRDHLTHAVLEQSPPQAPLPSDVRGRPARSGSSGRSIFSQRPSKGVNIRDP